MTEKKRIELTRLQGGIAIASFAAGVSIAAVCLFIVPPPGEIANSAIGIVSELLVLCGAILGVKASFDARLMRFQAEVRREIAGQAVNDVKEEEGHE